MIALSRRIVSWICLLQVAVGFFALSASGEPAPVSFDVAPPAAWVRPFAPPSAPSEDVASNPGGVAYLLLDRQENVAPAAFYRHEVRKITSEAGVQNGAAISVTFDPSYEKLIIHSITGTRDGVSTNRLDREKIQLLRREPELESFVYDGAYTAQCELEDVRVGDVIEFAYTLEGANPIKKGKYSSLFATDWRLPARRAIARVIAPSGRKLSLRTFNGAPEPKVTSTGDTTEWLLEQHDVPARPVENDAPADYDPRGAVEFTEYENWAQVVAWARAVFDVADPHAAEVESEAKKLREIPDPEGRILAALRFVQDDVRYLGVEAGEGSHQPTAPGEVLRRRFGDCKDKVLLLATLLRHTGIDAAPALVSSSRRAGIKGHLPRPEVFDHAILHVRLGEATHWLDATRSGQRGPLSQVYVRDFGYALLLRDGADALTPVTPAAGAAPRKHIVNNYRIPAPGGAADLQVISDYRGLAADLVRSSFRDKGAELTQKECLQYYARRFPAIRTTKPIVFEELAGENGCRIVESYSIPEVWQLSEDGNKYEILLYPAELEQRLGSPASTQRDDPLALEHPTTVVEEINSEMFEPWPMNMEPQEITTPFFRFREEPWAQDRQVRLKLSYESLADRVPVADLPKYNAAVTKAREATSYTLSYSTPEQLAAMQRTGRFNWPIAVLLAVSVAAAAFAAWRFYRSSKVAEPLPAVSPRHDGLAGWLILVALGMIATPWALIRANADLYPSVLNVETWRLLTDPGNPAYHPFWAPALLFGLFFNTLYLVLVCLLLALFFKRRAAWRTLFIAYLLIGIAGLATDYLLTRQIPAAASVAPASAADLVRSVISAAIWIPYAMISLRVRSTFRH